MKALYAITGTRFRGPEIEALVRSLPMGEPLVLQREATNQHDPNAVMVFARDRHVGYLSSRTNKKIANWLDVLCSAKKHNVTIPAVLRSDGTGWPMAEVEE